MPRTPCCHTPSPTGDFQKSIEHDAKQFSQYVALGQPVKCQVLPDKLTSSLHFEMKLWLPPPFAVRRYRINDAEHNAWKAALPPFTCEANSVTPKAFVAARIKSPVPRASTACALNIYDQWALTTILHIKRAAQTFPLPAKTTKGPSILTTVGMAAKLLNVYVKYQFCWEIAGVYPSLIPMPKPGRIFSDFCCALHSPIDSIIIDAIYKLPIGEHLRKQKLITSEKKLVQADAQKVYWSRLNCFTTYYGFQLILRRIAMATWPNGCACPPVNYSDIFSDWCKSVDLPILIGDGPDWINEAARIPDNVIRDTIAALGPGDDKR